MSSRKNSSRDGQCNRNSSCTKGKGHAGWCKTKGDSEAKDQGDLLAMRPSPRNNKANSRAEAMKELAERRKAGKKRSRLDDYEDEFEDEDEDDEDDEDEDFEEEEEEESDGGGGGSGKVEYTDFGMSRKERKAMREKGAEVEDANGSSSVADAWRPSWPTDGPPARLEDIGAIQLKRAQLEKWLLEPFFKDVVRGCVVRIGLQVPVGNGAMATIYRLGEVLDATDFPDTPVYSLGSKRTTKRLLLNFGEAREWYQMISVSNQPFEPIELLSSEQVMGTFNAKFVTAAQVQAKRADLSKAQNYAYSEADVTKRVEEERKQAAQQGKPAVLTTRQKMLQKTGGGRDDSAKPMKFQRDVLGRAVVAEHEE